MMATINDDDTKKHKKHLSISDQLKRRVARQKKCPFPVVKLHIGDKEGQEKKNDFAGNSAILAGPVF